MLITGARSECWAASLRATLARWPARQIQESGVRTTRAGSLGIGLGTPSENASQILAAMRVVTPRLACARSRARWPRAKPSARSLVTASAEFGWFLDEC